MGKYKHGLTHSKEWDALNKAKRRCYNPKDSNYKWYGARGIKVCNRWLEKGLGISNFVEDLGRAPSKHHSLDRIDPDKDYEPGNCRWATSTEQALNQRRRIKHRVFGEELYAIEICKKYNIDKATFYYRINNMGLTAEEAIKWKKGKRIKKG